MRVFYGIPYNILLCNIMNNEMPKDLSDALLGEDELGLAIRSHLYVENLLDELLAQLIPFPNLYEEMHLNYAGKVKLACDMGLDPSYKSMLLALGDIRNKFAHNLDKSIDEEMVKDLHSKVDEGLRLGTPVILNNISGEENVNSFRDAHPRDQFLFLVLRLWMIINSAIDQVKIEINA